MTGTQLILSALAVLLALAGALGVAWAVFRSTSEQKLREIDRQLLNSQEMLIRQHEAELARLQTDMAKAENFVSIARADLTQKAAVDHLLELVVREERHRADEHEQQLDQTRAHTALLKEIILILKQLRDAETRTVG